LTTPITPVKDTKEHFTSWRSFVIMPLDQTFAALSDPSRRAMLQRLAEAQVLSISALAAPLPIALPTVMKHLDVLSKAGLIERHKTGRTVMVSLAPHAMEEARAWLERTAAFWSGRLDRLTALVEEQKTP
jgi:DNA-binding transcriptional ArsR family regulator